MGQYTSYYLYQKYEERGEQEPIPCYPNVYSIDGEGTMPLVVKSSADTECGAEGTIEDWFAVSTYCVGVSKYEKQEKAISYDDGDTWVYTGEYRDELVEPYSVECGYVPPPPQYRTISGDTYCSGDTGFDLYVDIYSQVSYDGGISWHTISSASTLVETDSVDCGVKYRWQPSGTTCVGYDKWEQSIRQKSYDDGETWIDVAPLETSATTLIEEDSVDCGYSPTQERWIETSDTLCVEEPDGKLYVKYDNGTTYELPCDDRSSLNHNDTSAYSGAVEAVVGDCISNLELVFEGRWGCFAEFTSLSSITVSNSVTTFGESAFFGCESLVRMNSHTNGVLSLPNQLTTIGDYAFQSCRGFTSVIFPDTLTTISHFGFHGCDGLLGSLNIPDSVTTIGESAFSGHETGHESGLTSVTIGSGITTIWSAAFANNINLQSITIHATTPPRLQPVAYGSYVIKAFFDRTNNCPIYVPAASVNAYKSAEYWSDYANRIQPIT